eukprot:15182261-Alexandrium_andersonii.AAC.1
MSASLVGSEMCIRDRATRASLAWALRRQATSCPAATHAPSPASRVLLPYLQRATGDSRV